MTGCMLLSSVLLPVVAGILLPLLRFKNRKGRLAFVLGTLIAEAALCVGLLFTEGEMTVFSMTDTLTVALRVDGVSRLFACVAAFGYLLAGIYSFRYMDKEEAHGSYPENTFYAFFLLSLGGLIGMDLARNLVTMYFFFETVTLLSMPLVLFERTKESAAAAMKYLFYSIAGAFLALGCIFILSRYTTSMEFTAGGTLDMAAVTGHETLLYVAVLLGVIGFGAKAGMYPLHGWLPTAHPVAPAPASAVLSAVITKAGVLAILRVLFFTVGAAFLRGTWVQTVLLSLALLTVFMGSMMAFREKVFKKRLAYSSVSQISYVLFGLFLLTPTGVKGGLMQILFHATVKICLFLTAGSFIYHKGYHRVEELRGIGRELPLTLGAFTLASLSLIGIPPFAGFVSKWYLAMGSLESGLKVIDWLGPVVLLVSALLTAGYLLPVTVNGYFPGKDAPAAKPLSLKAEGGATMLMPLFVLAALALALGLCGGMLEPVLDATVASML